MTNKLIELPYKIARVPLTLAHSTLSQRLPETSVPRTTLDFVIGSTDKLMGTLLGDAELARRGKERVERSETLRKVARREHLADAKLKQAEQVATSGHKEAERKRQAAADRATESLERADEVEERDKREAEAEAKREAGARKRAADQEAERRASTIEQREQRASAVADAEKKAGQRRAKALFDEAREDEKGARQSRADAEKLEHLVETKARQRKED